jgi:A/G-specific adenine glycosylase
MKENGRDVPLMTPVDQLLEWFRDRARELPWRTEVRDPYQVLVSELMLQQTQVDRVVPKFEAFVARFPTLADLAAAAEQKVLEAWSGLGYYRRARLLHWAAKSVIEAGGAFPRSAEALQALPGVGPYTAAAIASLAFGEAAPVLDGNTMRVGARVLALEQVPKTVTGQRELRRWISELMKSQPPGEVNEALMELGAVVCTPRSPDCGECPLATVCRARELGRQEAYPCQPESKGRAAEDQRWVATCCIDRDGRWLLRCIDEGPILRGLWLPPLVQAKEGDDPIALARAALPKLSGPGGRALPPVKHSITYRRLTVVPVRFAPRGVDLPGEGWVWADLEALDRPTSSLLGKLAARVAEDG